MDEICSQVEQLFCDSPTYATRKLLSMPHLLEAVQVQEGASLAEKAYNLLHPGSFEAYSKCKTCSLPLGAFRSFSQGYKRYCNASCSANDTEKQELAKATMLVKYGVTTGLKTQAAKAAYKAAMLDKYGVEHAFQAAKVKAAVQATIRTKYGVEHAFSVPEVIQRARASKASQYEKLTWAERLKIIERDQGSKLKDAQEHEPHKLFTWVHACGREYTSKVMSGRVLSCPTCKHVYVSKGETEVADLLAKYTSVQRNVRSVLQNHELDIYCPELKLAIEYNGVYWHSSEWKTATYHLEKTEACERLGIKLIQIFEDEWQAKREIVSSRLVAICQKATRIFARACIVKPVLIKDATSFLEANHIQGSVGSKVRLGLYQADKLVALMTFGAPRFNHSYDWELLRYCTALNCVVVGGPSKLLAAFKAVNQGSIISYADRRWSTGQLYHNLGFTELDPSPPSFTYVIDGERVSRFKLQKHLLHKLLGERFDPNLSARENLEQAGYKQIHDCGHRVFVLDKA